MSDKEPILNSAEFDLDFQDFSNSIPDDAATIPTSQFSNFQPSLMTEEGETKLTLESDVLLEEENSPTTTTSAFWSFQFYQQFFNVDDQMVLERLMFACMPTLNSSYLDKLKPVPDLYGPLWVCITLITSTAISGNMADFFSSLGKDTDWEYDFKKVSIAGTVVFSYVTVVPALLSGFLWWRKSNTPAKLADILSLYGYSMSLFVPVSLLLCINYEWLRWVLIVALVLTSGGVLSLTVWKILEEEPKQLSLILTGLLFSLHLALILLFKVYFFAASENPTDNSTSPT